MLKGALIGFAVALGMLLPPILHWVTGPLGPLVGGFFGGSRARLKPAHAPIMGLLMGLFMAAPLSLLIAVGSVADSLLPDGLRSVLGVVAVVIVLYTGVMGSIGAAIGGALALREETGDGSTG